MISNIFIILLPFFLFFIGFSILRRLIYSIVYSYEGKINIKDSNIEKTNIKENKSIIVDNYEDDSPIKNYY